MTAIADDAAQYAVKYIDNLAQNFHQIDASYRLRQVDSHGYYETQR